MSRGKKTILVAVLLFASAAVAGGPFLLKLFPVPHLPSPRTSGGKKRPGQYLEVRAEGPSSVNGLCKVASCRGELVLEGEPAQTHPMSVTASGSGDWGDRLQVNRGDGATRSSQIRYRITALPDDPALVGRKGRLAFQAEVEFPYPAFEKGKLLNESISFENRKQTVKTDERIEFYAAGEYEKDQAAEAEYKAAREAQRELPFYRLRVLPSDEWRRLVAGCWVVAIVGLGTAVWVMRRPAGGPNQAT